MAERMDGGMITSTINVLILVPVFFAARGLAGIPAGVVRL